jgi:hypothetical protein
MPVLLNRFNLLPLPLKGGGREGVEKNETKGRE